MVHETLVNLLRGFERFWRELILCFLSALFLPLVCLGQGLPVHFVIGTFAFLLANAVWKYQISFDNRNLAALNLVEAANRLTKYQKNYNRSIPICFILALCWAFWYGKNLAAQHIRRRPSHALPPS